MFMHAPPPVPSITETEVAPSTVQPVSRVMHLPFAVSTPAGVQSCDGALLRCNASEDELDAKAVLPSLPAFCSSHEPRQGHR